MGTAPRLLSLDAFRGLTIAGMLLVNNPGSWSTIYDPLEHAAWHGWTPTDLIFPFFLFIVGVAMTLSFAKAAETGWTRRQLLVKALKRAALIFAVGLVLHSFPWVGYDFSHIRIMGVLQRIAVAYLFASLIFLYTRTTAQRVIVTAAILFGYWALQTLTPLPNGAISTLDPGRDLGSFIDRMILGEAHLWKTSKTWDPEGLLSTLPAIGTVLLGIMTGDWLRTSNTAARKAMGIILAGVACTAAGWIWSLFFPINKSLWTSSYVVFTGGIALLTFAAFYWSMDVRKWQRGATPFIIFGANAIAAFFLSSIGARVLTMIKVGPDDVALKTLLYRNLFLSWATPLNASLAFAITYVVFWLGIMSIFYYKRIFIKL